jgi:hypothetical protein
MRKLNMKNSEKNIFVLKKIGLFPACMILNEIAENYETGINEIIEEVTSDDAELLFEYRMNSSNRFEIHKLMKELNFVF